MTESTRIAPLVRPRPCPARAGPWLTSTARTAGSTRRSSSRRCGCRRPSPNPPDGRCPRRRRASGPWSERRFWPAVAIITAVAAVAAAVLRPHRHRPVVGGDGLDYHLGALRLADGLGYTRGLGRHRRPARVHPPPGWTTLLGGVSWLGARSVQDHQLVGVALGLAVVVLAAMVGRRYFNARVGLLAACVAALYPGFWLLEGNMLSEPLGLALLGVVLLLVADLRDHPTCAPCRDRRRGLGSARADPAGAGGRGRAHRGAGPARGTRSLSTLARLARIARRRRRDDRGPRALVAVQLDPASRSRCRCRRATAARCSRATARPGRSRVRAWVSGTTRVCWSSPASIRAPTPPQLDRAGSRRGGRQRPGQLGPAADRGAGTGRAAPGACSARARPSTSSPQWMRVDTELDLGLGRVVLGHPGARRRRRHRRPEGADVDVAARRAVRARAGRDAGVRTASRATTRWRISVWWCWPPSPSTGC